MGRKMQLWLNFLRILMALIVLTLVAWILFPGYFLGLLIWLGMIE